MQTRAFAWTVIGVGVLLFLISLFADLIGLGRYPGFGWMQGLGVFFGVVVVMVGLYFRRKGTPSP